FGPLQELGNVIAVYREAEASLNNFKEIMEMPQEYKPSSPLRLDEVKHLEFKDVSFKHASAPVHALSEISFQVNKGETVAFVGPSGSGKSTLVKLLVGLYSPLAGSINYNKISSDKINLDDLRKQIGFVTQDTQLFAGT